MSPLADRLIRAFLEPALTETDWREKWKGVNRAAGVVSGWGIAAGIVSGVDAAIEVERVIVAVEDSFNATPAHVQITDGLRKRVAEILVLMS